MFDDYGALPKGNGVLVINRVMQIRTGGLMGRFSGRNDAHRMTAAVTPNMPMLTVSRSIVASANPKKAAGCNSSQELFLKLRLPQLLLQQ